MKPLLSLKDVSIVYPGERADVRAVRNVSLDVAPGETLGLVGESGSGKSSLAAAMLGLLPAGARIEGSVHFEDREMTALAEPELRRLRGSAIATIAQDPFTALNPVLRIGSQMVAFQHWHKELTRAERWKRATEMLEKVGLSDPETRMRQFPHQLSGGSRQRVAIGAALLAEPRLLIADEPTTALDATTEAQILAIMREAKAELTGSTIFITHDISVVSRVCDRVAVLYAGELLETGPVAEVLSNPQHPYTKALLECDPARISEPTRTLPTIPGTVPRPNEPRSGCTFSPRCPAAFGPCTTERPALAACGESWKSACHLVTV
ncbi:ABC transporter ATP-binding protein [Martelella radicis]|uniref:Peptide/nickel transport system ATP-binding protein n=1 Tax=Martelella radicis TaxID=1397476 RepID=A0A7W6P8J9_9HYPH|nr:ABC transporter ATP-binding protein [Martelella radicis]MBB4120416.1 peptide/nickel transport system ATP-binding protein [Martelella radicis]